MSKLFTTEARAEIGSAYVDLLEATFSNSDVCSILQAELREMFPNQYAYLENVFGDDQSGDVVYCCGSEKYRAPYEIGSVNGAVTCAIDDSQAVEVVCVSSYMPVADDADHMADMDDEGIAEALKTEKIFERFPGSKDWLVPLAERFISKDERDAADSSDFAGKGKSYPILKPGDVMAAVRSMGRAGSGNKSLSALKASIIRIAKKKGWTKYLPKAWQGDSATESAPVETTGTLTLRESAEAMETIVLREAKADYPIKLIAPGKGSSAFYPSEVLKRDGPKVFGAGTHVYLNHPTEAEEAARPEGDVANLAGVLTSTAVYDEAGPKGPGLYARMKVFADHAQAVEEKAPYVGMSIRASGIAESGKTRDGLPILKELVSAESVDVVTRAGAGGMILTESAREAQTTTQEADTMSPEEMKKLIEASVAEATAPLTARLLKADCEKEARRLLSEVELPQAAVDKVVERVIEALPMKDGQLDTEAFRKLIVTEAKSMGSFLSQVTGSGRVVGMGASSLFSEAEPEPDKKALKEAKRRAKEERKADVDVFEAFMGGDRKAAKLAVMKGVA